MRGRHIFERIITTFENTPTPSLRSHLSSSPMGVFMVVGLHFWHFLLHSMHWSYLIYKRLLARPMYDSLKELSWIGSLPNSHLSSYRATIKYRLLSVLMAHRLSPATWWPPTIFDKTHPLCGNSIVVASITVCTHMTQVPASIHSCWQNEPVSASH